MPPEPTAAGSEKVNMQRASTHLKWKFSERHATITRSVIRRLSVLVMLAVFVGLVPGTLHGASARHERPNIVFIMTDNQSAWSLGCYGNRDIHTPNIDRLAQSGIRFTQCFSSNAVCSPTRATWLTGLMPSQHGVHCYIHPSRQIGPQAFSTIAEFESLGTILARAGYTCGLAGKWHLGLNMKPQCGFTFWVTKPGGHTTGFYNQHVIENGKISEVPGYITDYWTERGIEFIRKNRNGPFFLFLAYNGPYGLSNLLLRPARNRHAAEYADSSMPFFPRRPRHAWLYNNYDYLDNVVSMRRYAAEISGIDDGVGRIVDELKQLGIHDRTLIVFTADQGLGCGQGGIWGMGDHTRPLSAFDTTMHVPLIFSWPGHIASARRCDLLVSNYDFFPSLLTFIGLENEIPTRPRRPGRCYAAVLENKNIEQAWDDTVFYEFENVRAVRTRDWKLVHRLHGGPAELYDLRADPEEQHNLIDRPEHAAFQSRLDARLAGFFKKYVDPKYDLAHGGTSKAGFLLSQSTPFAFHSARDHAYYLNTANAQLAGSGLHVTTDWRGITGWRKAKGSVSWTLRNLAAGSYKIELDARGPAGPNAPAELQLDRQPLQLSWSPTRAATRPFDWLPSGSRHWQTYAMFPKGNHRLAVRLRDPHGAAPYVLYRLRLVRTDHEQPTGSKPSGK